MKSNTAKELFVKVKKLADGKYGVYWCVAEKGSVYHPHVKQAYSRTFKDLASAEAASDKYFLTHKDKIK